MRASFSVDDLQSSMAFKLLGSVFKKKYDISQNFVEIVLMLFSALYAFGTARVYGSISELHACLGKLA